MNESFAKNNQKDNLRGITNISITGYKSLESECNIEVRPLTILAGANSSGKSSVIQPLLLLKQTLEATYDPGALKLDGPNVKFTSASQFFSRIQGKTGGDRFSIKLTIDGGLSLTNIYGRSSDGVLEILESTVKKEESVSNLFSPSLFAPPIRRLIHVPGFRGNPERNYKLTGISSAFPGTFEIYTASIINHWQKTDNPRLIELWKAMETLELTSKVVAKKLNDIEIELLVSDLPGKDDENHLISIADVGFGLSQILPVIVALIVAEPGQLVYLEQPEIHLHPRATAALGDLLVKAANRGVKVIAETHSDLLLRRVQSLVAEGKIAPENLKLHWFQLKENGVTEINSADLDDAGAYGEDWPEDFSDVALDEESRYLDAAEARLLVR
jgi:hypothetical protein